MKIPLEFSENILSLYGESGKFWLQNLPQYLKSCEAQWQLQLEPCYDNLSFNYVAPAKLLDGTVAVLKCSPPNLGFTTEIATLKHFAGYGAVKLLHEDISTGKMLLEKITPAYSLENFSDYQQAITISVELMQKLHKPIADKTAFPTAANWFQDFTRLRQTFSGGTGPLPAELVDQAEQISQALLTSMGETVVLHGDLHYGNILFSAERGWLAIDPKGVIAEREFEIPLPRLDTPLNQRQLAANLNYFIELTQFDQQRVLHWLFAKAVLAAYWSFEDQGQVSEKFITCATIVKNLL